MKRLFIGIMLIMFLVACDGGTTPTPMPELEQPQEIEQPQPEEPQPEEPQHEEPESEESQPEEPEQAKICESLQLSVPNPELIMVSVPNSINDVLSGDYCGEFEIKDTFKGEVSFTIDSDRKIVGTAISNSDVPNSFIKENAMITGEVYAESNGDVEIRLTATFPSNSVTYSTSRNDISIPLISSYSDENVTHNALSVGITFFSGSKF